MLHETGLTVIITPLRSLRNQVALESATKGFPAVSITAEVLGENPKLVTISYHVRAHIIF